MDEVRMNSLGLLEDSLKSYGKDRMLYRVMTLEQFIDMMLGRPDDVSHLPVNRLVRPWMWEDPYEKLLLRDDMKKSLNSECWFGQCWSVMEESDSIWRMISKNYVQRCVKIKVSLDNLLESLREYDNSDSFFILDAIKYTGKKVIDDFANYTEAINQIIKDNPEFEEEGLKILFSILFMKRIPFENEREVRLLVCDKTAKEKDKTWTYPFDVNKYVEEIVFDPWTKDYQLKLYKSLLDDIGVDNVKEKVRTSDLYKRLKISKEK